MLRREARARLHVARVAVRDRDGEPRRHERTRARRELDALAGREVHPRVAAVRARRDDSAVAHLLDLEPDRHALSRCERDSATRNGANRRSSRRGRRAITSTPSGVSSRSSTGAPSAYSSASRAAVRIRDEQPDALPAILEPARQLGLQLLEPLAGQRRHLRRVREAVREPAAPERIDAVDLVQHDHDGQLRRADLVQHVADRVALPVLLVVERRGIDHVEHDVGDERLFERRREPFDEVVRQPADEADRVGDEVAAAFVVEAARRRIERVEELILEPRRPRPVSAFSSVDLPTFV